MPTVRSNELVARFLLAAALLSAAISAGQAAPEQARPHVPLAEDLFVRILQSDDLFTYQGRQITTYWTTGRATDVEVYHHPPDLQRIYYLDPERLRGLLLVSDGRQQWQYDPHRTELHHRLLSPGALDDDNLLSYTLLRANYLLSVDAQPRTWADRKVWLITIKRPGGRTLARKFWVDDGSGLILKREIYREDGRLAVTVAFSDITFHPKPSGESFRMDVLAKTPGIHFVESHSVTESPLALSAVRGQLSGEALAPPSLSGYRLIGASVTVVSDKSLVHLRYSDGLNLVSLFEQRRSRPSKPTRIPPGMRPIQLGAIQGYISRRTSLTTLNWDMPALNLTLMGEMGADALRALAVEAVKKR